MAKSDKKPTQDDIQAQIDEIRQDVKTLTETLQSFAANEGRQKIANLSDLAEQAGRTVSRYTNQAVNRVDDGLDDARHRIEEQPLSSTGAALGIGTVLGLVLAGLLGRR
jgi:ElaB/YqjD/DUF883 family membrane-anchored ribosome-binding protein